VWEKKYHKKSIAKRKTFVVLGILVGAAVSIAGGFLLGNLFAKKRKGEKVQDSLFIDQITEFMLHN